MRTGLFHDIRVNCASWHLWWRSGIKRGGMRRAKDGKSTYIRKTSDSVIVLKKANLDGNKSIVHVPDEEFTIGSRSPRSIRTLSIGFRCSVPLVQLSSLISGDSHKTLYTPGLGNYKVES